MDQEIASLGKKETGKIPVPESSGARKVRILVKYGIVISSSSLLFKVFTYFAFCKLS